MPLDLLRRQRPAGEGGGRPQRRDVERTTLAVGRQRDRVGAEAVDEQIADDLGDQLAVVFDQLSDAGRPGAQPALGQGLLAEPVDRRDRRLVEAGERQADPLGAALANTVGSGVEDAQPVVAGRKRATGEEVGGALQLVADAIAQLGGGGPCVRDDEHLVDRHPLGEVVAGEVTGHEPCDEGGDRVGLAGSGARLDERPTRRECGGEVEGRRGHWARCRSSTLTILANASTEPHR